MYETFDDYGPYHSDLDKLQDRIVRLERCMDRIERILGIVSIEEEAGQVTERQEQVEAIGQAQRFFDGFSGRSQERSDPSSKT